MGNPRPGVLLACALLGLGCRTTAAPAAPPPRRADQLATRDPDSLGKAPSARTALGSLAPVAPDAREAQAPTLPADATVALTPLIEVADDAVATPYPLRGDGALVLPGGLTIQRVPRGIVVHALRERGSGDEVWEITDARGRRQALIKARSVRRAVAADDALRDSAPVRGEALRARWRGASVDVRVDRFQHDAYVYTLERRAAGTGWIWNGLSFNP